MRTPRKPKRPRSEGQCSTHKVRYADELGALMGLASVQRWGGTTHDECRVYECPMCEGWHTTSQPLSEWEAENPWWAAELQAPSVDSDHSHPTVTTQP